MASEQTVLEIEAGRMVAIAASVDGARVRVRQFDVSVVPLTGATGSGAGGGASAGGANGSGTSVGVGGGDDAATIGSAVRARLDAARLGRRGVTLVVPRAEVVVKALSMPRAVTEDAGELATAVRFQMARQLTMSLEGTAIDYAEPGADGDAEANRTVLAGAIPSERAAWWRAVAQGAGVRVAHMRMKAFAIAEIVGELTQQRGESVLAVAVGPGSVEFVLVEDGRVVSSRSADVVVPMATAPEAEQVAFRDKVGVEARRAAMPMLSGGSGGGGGGGSGGGNAKTGVRGNAAPTLIAVVGDGALANALGSACGAALGLAWTTVGVPAGVELPAEMTDVQRTLALPLVGTLLGPARGRRGLDFAQPRKAPDPKAKARQVVLAGVLLAMVVGGAAFVVGDQMVSGKRATLAVYKEREKSLREQLIAASAADARLRHMELSERAHADWLAHLAEISALLPAGTEIRLDEVSGSVTPRVEVAPAVPYAKSTWKSSARAAFTLAGSMKDRDANAELRERVLASGRYALQMPTADTPDRFTLRLVDVNAAPRDEEGREGNEEAKQAKGGEEAEEVVGETATENVGEDVSEDGAEKGGAE